MVSVCRSSARTSRGHADTHVLLQDAALRKILYYCECDGFDYHRAEERRRGPEIRYGPMACPSVKPSNSSEWLDQTFAPKETIVNLPTHFWS